MGKLSVEVQVTVVHHLREREDATEAADAILAGVRRVEAADTLVHLNALTLKDGRQVLRRLHYRRRP